MLDFVQTEVNMAHEIKSDKKKKPKGNVGGFGQQPPRLEIPQHPDDKRLKR
jgi:hypothetical protein